MNQQIKNLENLDDRIGHTLRAVRLQRGMQATDVAARVDKTKDWLYRLERGGSWSLYHYLSVCIALGLSDSEAHTMLNTMILDHRLKRGYPPLFKANP